MNAGFDIALAGRPFDIISICSVKSIAAESVFEPSLAEFPGPLFTGLPTIGLGRATGAQSNAVKTKKATILSISMNARMSLRGASDTCQVRKMKLNDDPPKVGLCCCAY
jgi:hypothetical protein